MGSAVLMAGRLKKGRLLNMKLTNPLIVKESGKVIARFYGPDREYLRERFLKNRDAGLIKQVKKLLDSASKTLAVSNGKHHFALPFDIDETSKLIKSITERKVA